MNPPLPVVWIVATGTEILQGHYADRNAPWISARLMQLGLPTARHMALPDAPEALRAGLADAARQAGLIVMTGGLGPTEDDCTRRVVAEVWERPLAEDPEALAGIEARLAKRGRKLRAANRVQALLPSGARLMPNANGTAPGFFIAPDGDRAALLALPGPPHEMQPMFDADGLPRIKEAFDLAPVALRNVAFRTAGLPEAAINERLRDLFDREPMVRLALLFTFGSVDVRLTLLDPDATLQARRIEEWAELVAARLGAANVYGRDRDTLASVVGGLLRDRAQTVALAESCTGGLIGGALTDVAGSSDYFVEGFVTYRNTAKTARLGVDAATIERHGAVSAEVAEAMAAGARRAAGSDWALSVTGIAGPGGGSEDKPVGLVWFGLAGPEGTITVQRRFAGGRDEIRLRATQAGLDLLRRGLLGVALDARLPVPSSS